MVLSWNTMIFLEMPIIFAAKPTQCSLFAWRVSRRSVPIGRSSGVAISEGILRNSSSFMMSFIMSCSFVLEMCVMWSTFEILLIACGIFFNGCGLPY